MMVCRVPVLPRIGPQPRCSDDRRSALGIANPIIQVAKSGSWTPSTSPNTPGLTAGEGIGRCIGLAHGRSADEAISRLSADPQQP